MLLGVVLPSPFCLLYPQLCVCLGAENCGGSADEVIIVRCTAWGGFLSLPSLEVNLILKPCSDALSLLYSFSQKLNTSRWNLNNIVNMNKRTWSMW